MKKTALCCFLLSIVACSQNPATITYNNKKFYGKNGYFTEDYHRGMYKTSPQGNVVRDLSLKNKLRARNEVNSTVENEPEIKQTKVEKSGNELVVADNKSYDMDNYKEKNTIVKKEDNQTTQDYKYITVHQGENLFRIAKNNDIPFVELAEINGIKEPYNISVGQQIKVPLGKVVDVTPVNVVASADGVHIVKAGETMYSISKAYGMSVPELAQKNNLKEPYTLSIGQKLYTNNTIKVADNNVQNVKVENKLQEQPTQQKPVVVEAPKSSQGFVWPVDGGDVIAKFGDKINEKSLDGINIKIAKGTGIKASKSGEVIYAGNELKSYGNLVILKHENNYLSVYAHCDTINVKVKDKVNQGDIIATVGSSGSGLFPQLYFSIREGRTTLDPLKILPQR